MSKVTYFTSRQKVMEVLGANLAVPFTDVDLTAYVPAGATGVIAKVEIESAVAGGPLDWAQMTVRKDAAQGICGSVNMPFAQPLAWLNSDNCIIPLDANRKFQYDLNGAFAGLLSVNLRIYILGYLT